jgi:hypothetical protein
MADVTTQLVLLTRLLLTHVRGFALVRLLHWWVLLVPLCLSQRLLLVFVVRLFRRLATV